MKIYCFPIKLWAINHSMIKRIYWINVNMSTNYQLQIHLQSSIDNKKLFQFFVLHKQILKHVNNVNTKSLFLYCIFCNNSIS